MQQKYFPHTRLQGLILVLVCVCMVGIPMSAGALLRSVRQAYDLASDEFTEGSPRSTCNQNSDCTGPVSICQWDRTCYGAPLNPSGGPGSRCSTSRDCKGPIAICQWDQTCYTPPPTPGEHGSQCSSSQDCQAHLKCSYIFKLCESRMLMEGDEYE